MQVKKISSQFQKRPGAKYRKYGIIILIEQMTPVDYPNKGMTAMILTPMTKWWRQRKLDYGISVTWGHKKNNNLRKSIIGNGWMGFENLSSFPQLTASNNVFAIYPFVPLTHYGVKKLWRWPLFFSQNSFVFRFF